MGFWITAFLLYEKRIINYKLSRYARSGVARQIPNYRQITNANSQTNSKSQITNGVQNVGEHQGKITNYFAMRDMA